MDHNNATRRKGRPPKFRGSDCHTCIELRRKCDGARPRCKNCQRSGIVCGGFTIQLSWVPGFSTHRKPTRRSIVRRSLWNLTSEPTGARQLEFIEEHPATVAIRQSSASKELAVSHHPDYQIPASVLYNGKINQFESICERCRSSVKPDGMGLSTNKTEITTSSVSSH
jgi:hypothetical protein